MSSFRLGGFAGAIYFALGLAACAGNLAPPPEAVAPCAVTVFAKSCAAAGGCHAPPDSPKTGDLPSLPGFDLSPAGIRAANNGASFVSKKASDDPAGACGAGAKIPFTGKLIVDPNNAQASLLYEKLGPTPVCGSHMPLLGKPLTLSAADQQCILDWIENLPGVTAGGSRDGSAE